MNFPSVSSPAFLSPMSGVTDVAFRALCKRYGAGMTTTEFVSTTALVRRIARIQEILVTDPIERPVGVQVFGNDPDELAEAARILEDRFDVIDLNCGCPAPKVIGIGAGSAMLSDPSLIATCVAKMVHAVQRPVTVKIRSGIDAASINAVEVAKAAEGAGASAIAVHGRTREQGYSGKADWDLIRRVKESVRVPVMGNGDVFSPEDFVAKKAQAGVDYVLVGRGAMGNPLLFADINGLLACDPLPSSVTKRQIFDEYLALAMERSIPFLRVKQQAIFFTKGVHGAGTLRNRFVHAKSMEDLLIALGSWGTLGD